MSRTLRRTWIPTPRTLTLAIVDGPDGARHELDMDPFSMMDKRFRFEHAEGYKAMANRVVTPERREALRRAPDGV